MSTTFAKPSGIPVLPPHGDALGDCVVKRVLSEAPWRADHDWADGFAAGVCHRLDVATSGALLFADDLEEFAAIRHAFQTGVFTKTYRFVAAADVPWTHNECDRAIAHAPRRRKGRMVVQRGANTAHRGKWYPARTRFRHLGGRLWEATMHTGVMHQIRVHAAWLGLRLDGDRHYGGGEGGFCLHHIGLVGDGIATDSVPLPEWANPH